jgi:hypothetical protein
VPIAIRDQANQMQVHEAAVLPALEADATSWRTGTSTPDGRDDNETQDDERIHVRITILVFSGGRERERGGAQAPSAATRG